jgi:hypothetical protein
MKTTNIKIVFILLIACFTAINLNAQSKGKTDPNKQVNTAITNATKAKMPKGTLSFKGNDKTYTARENQVQCMFVGMGMPNMAQGMISARGADFNISGVMMTEPKIGKLKIDKRIPTIGMVITINGEDYKSSPNDLEIKIDHIKPDGGNHYIGGTFSGTFISVKGQSIKVTEGKYRSAYL